MLTLEEEFRYSHKYLQQKVLNCGGKQWRHSSVAESKGVTAELRGHLLLGTLKVLERCVL